MDGYRDLYRVPVSAGYYASSRYPSGYGVEGRSSYALTAGDPLYSAYPRAGLDAYAGYGATVAYQPEFIPVPRHSEFLSPRRRMSPKRRPPPQNNGKRRLAFAESLTPKKKPFKKSQKGSHVENFSPRGGMRKRSLGSGSGSERKPLQQEEKNAGKPQGSLDATLVKETEELHKLFRTGVDSGKKIVKPVAKQADGPSGKKNGVNKAGQKRKADEQKKGPSKKKNRGKKKKFAKEKKQDVKKGEKPVEAPKAVKAEPAPLTEEEKKEMELSLELQKAACKAVAEFLGIPEKSAEVEKEPEPEPEEKTEAVQAAGDEAQEEKPDEAQDKVDEVPKPPPTLSPEEEKELEEKGFTFFSKMLEEDQDLRKLYLDKKDGGTFECLVCHSVDPVTSKKFTNLTSLVMHTSMRKQKRPEHRGYGKAICDILGWESLRAPKRPARQAKDDAETTKQVEAAGEVEEKQEGANEE